MSDQPPKETIPVRLSETKTVHLSGDTLIILAKDMGGHKLSEVRFQPIAYRTSREIKTWKMVLNGDHNRLVYRTPTAKQRKAYRERSNMPPHKRQMGDGWGSQWYDTKVEPDGKVLGQVSMQRLYGIKSGTDIVFQEGDDWVLGSVQPYLPWREIDKAHKKATAKEAYAGRRYAERPTAYDRLDDWDEDIG